MDASKFIVLGAGIFAVYWFFLRPQSAVSQAIIGTPGVTPSLTTAGPSLDSLAAAILAASAHDSTVKGQSAGPDTWNFYLMQVYPALGSAPDPMAVFPGIDRSQMMPWATYWAGMSAWLKTNKGLSGWGSHGLGAFGEASWGGM